jgi:hypothetical protein
VLIWGLTFVKVKAEELAVILLTFFIVGNSEAVYDSYHTGGPNGALLR